jgi:hypothetical protein
LKILFIGDIVGRPGRRAVRELVPVLNERYGGLDLVVANAENAAGGRGLTEKLVNELSGYGVDFMTTGNHVWDQSEFVRQIENAPNVLRPVNLPEDVPGRGSAVVRARNGIDVGIVNIAGAVFMPYDNPYPVIRPVLAQLPPEARVVLVDFHAEATAEKIAMGWFLDGIVSAVVGTHTHVQTADETVLPSGTAYITDVGMTGPHASVIGSKFEQILPRFTQQMPTKTEVASGDVRLCAVLIDVDESSGQARSIERLRLDVDGPHAA